MFGIDIALCYAMSRMGIRAVERGTDMAYLTNPCYAMSVGEPSIPTAESQVCYLPTRACYAMPGTDLAYGCISLDACWY
eukprot:3927346-Rhodomonas_salina.1